MISLVIQIGLILMTLYYGIMTVMKFLNIIKKPTTKKQSELKLKGSSNAFEFHKINN